MSATLLQFPQQKAWTDAQEIAKEEREAAEKKKQTREERNVKLLYHGGGLASYGRLLSDPPSIFKVELRGPPWGGGKRRGHFIANRERMPIDPASIIDPKYNGGLIIEVEAGGE